MPSIDLEKTDCGHTVGDLNDHGGCTRCVADGLGAKADIGKVEWMYLFDLHDALTEIAFVLAFGAKKYARGNYVNVKEARDRYVNALLRHVIAWYARGDRNDDGPGGSKRHHLAAAGCCLLFLLAMDLRGLFEKKDPV